MAYAEPRIIPAGHAFGEGALLMPGSVADSTYRSISAGCTLLVVPRPCFYQLLDKDMTLLAALHVKLLRGEASLKAILTHPRARAAFAGFLQKVCADYHSLDAYESMHAYARLSPAGLHHAARTVGEAIVTDFLLPSSPKPASVSEATRNTVLINLGATRGLSVQNAWPPDLFAAAEAELEELIRRHYMPQFTEHPIFEHILLLLGNYDADNLFPPDKLEHAKQMLVRALEGDLSVTAAAEHTLTA